MERITFHKEYYDIIKRLKKVQDRANLSLAVMEFIFEDKSPDNLPEVAEMAFELLLPSLRKSKNMSGRGGRPKCKIGYDLVLGKQNQIETKSKPNQNQMKTKRETTPNEKERTKEKEITPKRENLESKKERNINKTNNAYACEEEMKSHEDIMQDYCLTETVCESLKEFLRHCYLNKHIVSNAKLEDIIFRLIERYGTDEKGTIECIEQAIRGGYMDVKA